VSIICPVYCHTEEHKKYLSEALISVAAQTYRECELVIVDDTSPIDISDIVKSVERLPRPRILRTTTNLGHAEARNVGIQAAEGKLIAFLDHDDIWLPDKLEKQVAILNANPDVAMTFCDVEIFWQDDTNTTSDMKCFERLKRSYFDQTRIPDRPTLAWLMLYRNCVITVSSVLVRKHVMREIGLFDTRYSSCDDYDAWLKIRARWPIIHLPEVLTRYRLHKYNANYDVDHLRDNRLLTALMMDLWRQFGVADKLRVLPILVRKSLGRIYWTLMRR
ncbi:MAG: glycosyltransferase family 2 protein, partial [Armatimonadota bacterium]